MAIIFRFHDIGPEQVRFGFAPAQDALHSLRVLFMSKRYPSHIDWVLRTRKKVSPALRAELQTYSPMWQYGHPLFWDLRVSQQHEAFAEQIEQFRDLSIDIYVKKMLSAAVHIPTAPPPDREMTLELLVEYLPQLEQAQPQAIPFYRGLLDDAEGHRDRLADLLGCYWEEGLGTEWERLESLMVRDIERRADLMLRHGVIHGLVNLSRDLHVNVEARTALVSYRPSEIEVPLTSESTLYLTPSYFTWPYSLIAWGNPEPLICYPLMQQQQAGHTPVPPERLLQLLKATSDMTRLQILQLISKKPRSTRELAGLIGITEAAVSKQLKLLHEAELILPKRQSHYVFYELSKGALHELTDGIGKTFDLI